MDRIARLLSTSTKSSRILEIGAGYCPAAPKAAGWQTHVVDHASQEELQRKYASAPVDVTAIEAVDTVWRSGTLQEAVPAALLGQFDTVIASHVLEHLPDLIGFLESAAILLAPGGTISVALPDRRFCFDYFRPAPTTGDLLEAHSTGRTRHSLRTAWNHTAYAVTVDGGLAWGQNPITRPVFIDSFNTAAAILARAAGDLDSPALDFHVWPFTPAGFCLAILELGQLGATDWRVESLYGPDSFEFFVVLRRGAEQIDDAEALQRRRMELLRRQLMEIREQADFALAGEEATGPGHVSREADATLRAVLSSVHDQDARLRDVERVVNRVRRVLRPIEAVRRTVLSFWRT